MISLLTPSQNTSHLRIQNLFKKKSPYSIQKVYMHAKINQCQIWTIYRGKHDHFTFLLICLRIPRMTSILGRREYTSKKCFLTVLASLNLKNMCRKMLEDHPANKEGDKLQNCKTYPFVHFGSGQLLLRLHSREQKNFLSLYQKIQ